MKKCKAIIIVCFIGFVIGFYYIIGSAEKNREVEELQESLRLDRIELIYDAAELGWIYGINGDSLQEVLDKIKRIMEE